MQMKYNWLSRKKNDSENQKIGIEQFSYNNVRKTILARRCSSTGKCCSFGGASTYKNRRDLMIAKTKIIGRQWGFLSGGRINSQKRWNCADRSYFVLWTRNNCCSKWVPTPFSCQNNEIFGPTKALENGPRYQNTGFFEKMVKWVAYDTIGRMTNFSNTNGNATEKIKGRFENKTKNVFINVPIAYFWLET